MSDRARQCKTQALSALRRPAPPATLTLAQRPTL